MPAGFHLVMALIHPWVHLAAHLLREGVKHGVRSVKEHQKKQK